MSRNGSGTYVAPSGSWNPGVTGQAATLGDWQILLADIVSALTQSLSRDGQGGMTGNLPLGGNKITGMGAATGTGQGLIFEQLFNQGTEQDLASAATTDIGAQLTNFLRITGTTTIASFGTNYKGPRFLRFAGVLTLTNSSTLICPSGANITTAVGDVAVLVPKATLGASDGWYIAAYQSVSGIVVNTANITDKAVTYAKIQDVTAGKVLGRDTSGNGTVQELPISVDSSGNVSIAGKTTFGKGSSAGVVIGDVLTNSSSVLRMQGTSAGKNWQIANNLNVVGLEFTPSTADGGTTYTTPSATLLSNGNFGFNSGYGSAATAYGCRAWGSVNGVTGATLASGGVSSTAHPSTGIITVNLSFTMPDANYSVAPTFVQNASGTYVNAISVLNKTTTSFQIKTERVTGGSTAAQEDVSQVNFTVHR